MSEEFWPDYEQACVEAELFRLPIDVAAIAVVGPLAHAQVAVDRHLQREDGSIRPVLVYTTGERSTIRRDWVRIDRPSDLVTALDRFRADGPIVVIDVVGEPPPWLRPLLGRLRAEGLELIHCLISDPEPDPVELTSWREEIGDGVVVDLVFPLAPGRVVDLLDRGEPVVSVAGLPMTGPLLMALRAARC